MDKEVQDFIINQSQVIAILALRVSVLEKLLLEKKIFTESELSEETKLLSKDFIGKIQDSLQKTLISKGKV